MQKKPRPHDTERRRASSEQWGKKLKGSTASRPVALAWTEGGDLLIAAVRGESMLR